MHKTVVPCKVKNKTKDKTQSTKQKQIILLSEEQSMTSFMIAVTQVKQYTLNSLSVSNIMRYYHN